MVRYIWDTRFSNGKFIYSCSNFNKETRICVPYSKEKIFVNILEKNDNKWCHHFKVKLFYSDGTVLEGWTSDLDLPIQLTNKEELFDGRFNQ